MNKTFVVLCMHRSGSSAIAGILHYLGVDMGEGHLMRSSKANQKGYFEDDRFVDLSTLILKCGWGEWNCLLTKEQILALRERFEPRVLELLNQRNGIWGWKDPRTVMTLPLYMPHLENPHFVVVQRDPMACAKSLNVRNKMSFENGLRFAAVYYSKIVDILSDHPEVPTLCVKYEKLIENPLASIREIADFVGLYGAVPEGFIDVGMNHYKGDEYV